MVDLREPLDSLIAPPSRFTAGTTFPRAKEIRLYDTTLRDGEQTPGVAFTPEQKYELAGLLSDAGLHMLDVGFPSAAASERRALELILAGKRDGRLRKDLEIVVMCRSNTRDIDTTVEILKEMGAEPTDVSFFIFTSGSDLHLKYKIGKTLLQLEGRRAEEWLDLPVAFYREANVRMATQAIAHARRRGVAIVEFGGEDGSRADVGYLIELGRGLLRRGGHALRVSRHRRLLRARGRRLLHPEARRRLPRQAAGHPLPQRLRARRLQHRARPSPRRHHPHRHRERHRGARGQRAPAHHGHDPEGAVRDRRSRASATTCCGRCARRSRR